MSYGRTDFVIITEVFDSGDTVTIDIINVDTDSLVVSGASCTELTNMSGVFKYKFTPSVTTETVFVYKMTNGSYTKYGTFVFGGYIDETVTTINDEKATKIDVINANLIGG